MIPNENKASQQIDKGLLDYWLSQNTNTQIQKRGLRLHNGAHHIMQRRVTQLFTGDQGGTTWNSLSLSLYLLFLRQKS